MSKFYWAYSNTFCLSINKIIKLILIILLILTFFYKSANADETGVIKIPKHNWSSQLVGAEVIGELMKMVGERIEYVYIDSQKVYQSMADGEIDIVHEIWEGAFGYSYEKAKARGGVEEILSHNVITREDWWYPDYVEKECPGLPDWQALADCSVIFAEEGSDGKGVFIAGPVDWMKNEAKKIAALNMNFIVKNVASAEAIWAELDAAVEKNKPIVIFNWSPNFIGAKYPGKFVEFPKHDRKCFIDPAWGINPEAVYDCGNPTNEYLKLAVNKDFKKNHPKGYKVIKQINFSGNDIEKMANYIETDNMEVPSAAKKWLEENKNKWRMWIK